MSLWGFDREDNSLTTWSSLSQFDDMVWNEFGETNGDHVVPNPTSPESSWLPNEDRRKRMHREPSLSESTVKGESTTSTGVADSVADFSSDDEDGSKEVVVLQDTTGLPSAFAGGWTDLASGAIDLRAESEPFGSDHPPGSQETEDDIGDEGIKNRQSMSIVNEDGLYTCVENASMVTAPFSISDVSSQDGDLEMFENENVASKADSLLDLSWEHIGNLDDMDKLFRNNDTSFEPVMVNGTDGLDWPSPSPPAHALDNGMQFEKSSPVSEPTSVKIELDVVEDKTELVFGDCLPALVMGTLDDVVADSGSPRSLNISAGAPVQQHSLPCTDQREGSCEAKSSPGIPPGKEKPKEVTGLSNGSFPETEKVGLAQVYRARRQAANRKRSEDRFKRTTSYRKLSPGPPFNLPHADVRQLQTLSLRLPGQPPHLQSTSPFPRQYLPPTMTPGLINSPHQPHGVPYIHMGYPPHLVPPISSCPSAPMIHPQHPQPMFVDLQQSGSQGQRPPVLLHQSSPLASSCPFDASSRPPTSSPNMTPQEKLEKLRWRQQMQARMAVEQQQQLLVSQNGEELKTAMYHKQQQSMCQGLLPNQPGRPLTPTSEHLMKSPLEADQRVVVQEGDAVPTNDTEEEENLSLEGSVLCQLKSTVSALDIDTRLCIRDALYRLARSAMKRRAAGSDNLVASQGSEEQDSDANAVESSTASGPPPPSRHSRATSVSMVETETNPIDRSIAKLLFSRPQAPMFGRPCVYT